MDELLERMTGMPADEACREVISVGLTPKVIPYGKTASTAGVPDGTVILWISDDGTVSSAVLVRPEG